MTTQRPRWKRTHKCGELRPEHIGEKVILNGWVHRYRDHGGVLFLDLRDREGICQIVCDPAESTDAHATASEARQEWVLSVTGEVSRRPPGTENPALPTGDIEVRARRVEVLNEAKTPPFTLDEASEVEEHTRLKYRYLDLRSPRMQRNLRAAHVAAATTREYLNSLGFWEIETPLLIRATPEGARDYLVPSRTHPGHFFALPQSPQLFKQLLMVAGCDRYYQIARCLRDEDIRADRQHEFTQIDIEMAFVEQDDILEVTEGMLAHIVRAVRGVEVPVPFPRLTWRDAMERYGTDKPDTRFGLELVDLSDALRGCDFQVFSRTIADGGVVKAINVKGGGGLTRSQIDGPLRRQAADHGAKGLAWLQARNGGLEGTIRKYLSDEEVRAIRDAVAARDGDIILFGSDEYGVACESLAHVRLWLGRHLGLVDEDRLDFLWVLDFPLFEKTTEGGITPSHHPFTMPHPEDLHRLESDPLACRAVAHDVILNGNELGGGSIRIHKRDIQEKVFPAIGLSAEEAREKFGFLLEAFEYGAPPHGGIALGMARLLMILLKEPNIREVIPFPKTQSAADLMTGAPVMLDSDELKELHIRVDLPTHMP
ncbi:MAG: aspartate--tRNA ligase [Armatimonadota bacterium]